MKARLLLISIFVILLLYKAKSQTQVKKEYFVGECSKNDISIDGKLDEPAWQKANWQDDFIQYEPSEGKKPGQKTDFAILIDENYIYIGFKSWDTSADSIVQRLSRRDENVFLLRMSFRLGK